MLMVVGLVQVIAYQYATGAVQAALERGARAASVVGAGTPECEAALVNSLTEVLGGHIAAGVTYGCEVEGEFVRTWATGAVPGWMSSATDLSFDLEARAWMESLP